MDVEIIIAGQLQPQKPVGEYLYIVSDVSFVPSPPGHRPHFISLLKSPFSYRWPELIEPIIEALQVSDVYGHGQ